MLSRSSQVVLLVACTALAGLTGCREAAPLAGPGTAIQLSMHMTFGDRFVFTRTYLDQYGYPIPGSDVVEHWTVIATEAAAYGDTGVTVIVDSIGVARTDTLSFRFTSSGDVYGWGFLARTVADIGGGSVPRRWDLLARSPVAAGVSWAVGVDDPAGSDTVYASYASQPDYFSGSINGVPTVFTANHIDITSQAIVCTLWLTDSPSCIAGISATSALAANGFASTITSMTVAGQ